MDHRFASFRSPFSREGFCIKCFSSYFYQSIKLKKNCVCMECNTSEALWFCLDCAHLGCGRHHGGHALTHYNETKHMWVMNIETYQIWDYELSVYLQHNLNVASNTFLSIKSQADCHCPVCCQNQKPKLSKLALCMHCDLTENLWLCLSCNHIGCGRAAESHAFEHFSRTDHPKAMNMQNFSIWDYNEDKYLHRLVLDNPDAMKSELNFDFMEDFEERMPNMDDDWKNFSLLKETHRLMISIEQRIITLCEEKQQLEGQIREHDEKLNELINQFKDDNGYTTRASRTSLTATDQHHQSGEDHITATCLPLNWGERSSSSSSRLRIPTSVDEPQVIFFLIFLMFLYHFVFVFLQM